VNVMDVGEFYGRRLYPGLWLDYRVRMWAPTCASRVISAVAELVYSLDRLLIAESISLRRLEQLNITADIPLADSFVDFNVLNIYM